MTTYINVQQLRFLWPDGDQVFDGLDVVFSDGRTALIGDNGTGKSTLLRLVAGLLKPESGSITASGLIEYLPQELPLRLGDTVSDLLGIAGKRRALAAIEAGDVDEAHFNEIGEDWDFLDRSRVALDELGLDHVGFDRTVGTLSGGESMLVGLAGRLVRRPDVLLLDEPSNNLDGSARKRLYQAIRRFNGTLLVVSHDRALLEHVDAVADLYKGRIRVFEGNYSVYEEVIAAEQEAAARAVRDAKQDLTRQKKELIAARTQNDRGASSWRREQARGGTPKILLNAKKNAGEVSSAKLLNAKLDDVAEARDRLDEAEEGLRDDGGISVDLPETSVSTHRDIAILKGLKVSDLYGEGLGLHLRGPERVAVTGDNGSGKTTLLRAIADAARVPHGFLTQRLELLDDEASVLDNVRAKAPEADQSLPADPPGPLRDAPRLGLPAGLDALWRPAPAGGTRHGAVLAARTAAAPARRADEQPRHELDPPAPAGAPGVPGGARGREPRRGVPRRAGPDAPGRADARGGHRAGHASWRRES